MFAIRVFSVFNNFLSGSDCNWHANVEGLSSFSQERRHGFFYRESSYIYFVVKRLNWKSVIYTNCVFIRTVVVFVTVKTFDFAHSFVVPRRFLRFDRSLFFTAPVCFKDADPRWVHIGRNVWHLQTILIFSVEIITFVGNIQSMY